MAYYTRMNPAQFPFISLSHAARKLKTTPQRLGRYLIEKKIPVFREGYMVLLPLPAFQTIRGIWNKKTGPVREG